MLLGVEDHAPHDEAPDEVGHVERDPSHRGGKTHQEILDQARQSREQRGADDHDTRDDDGDQDDAVDQLHSALLLIR